MPSNEERPVETGLYWLSSRYYDPEIGRFISPDSVDYLDPTSINGLNLYAYCKNDPVNNADPSGHFPWRVLCFSIGLYATSFAVLFSCLSGKRDELESDFENGCLNPFNHDADVVTNSKVLSFYKGRPVIRHGFDGTCSIFGTIWADKSVDSEDIKHERGHLTQEFMLGGLYYTNIAAPSLTYNLYDRMVNGSFEAYYSMPWEITADYLGGAQRNFSYKDNSLLWGVLENVFGPSVFILYLLLRRS